MAKKKVPVPADVLKQYMEDYRLSAEQLADGIGLSVGAVRTVLYGKVRISLSSAFRLAKFFGTPAQFWIDTQLAYDIAELQNDQDLQSALGRIVKAKKGKIVASAQKPKKIATPVGKVSKSSKTSKTVAEKKPGRQAKNTVSASKPSKKAEQTTKTTKPAQKIVTPRASSRTKKVQPSSENDLQPKKVEKASPNVILIKNEKLHPQIEHPVKPDQRPDIIPSDINTLFPIDELIDSEHRSDDPQD
jgi:addiction module HigA family antidote